MPNQTNPDVERGMVTPQKKGHASRASPTKTEPLSPASTINIQTRDATPRGLFGMTRAKTFIMCFIYILLIGGLVYFILNWLEVPGLNQQLERLEGEIDRLAQENSKFAQLNDQLNVTVQDLKVVNQELGETADELNITAKQLNASVIELSDEVDHLEKLNDELNVISDYLNNTAVDLGESLEQLAEFLSDQIESSKVLVLANMEQAMRQKTMNWDCNFGAVFGQAGWTTDFNTNIPASDWTSVQAYVNENVLEELCLDESDFVTYLSENHETWSTNNLITAVTVYTQAAIDWYFPEKGEVGLTHDDWSKSSFDCENLETKFKYN